MPKKKPSAKVLASMRGNLQVLLAIPEEARTVAQNSAILSIQTALVQDEQVRHDKRLRLDARLTAFSATPIALETRPSMVYMILATLAYLADNSGCLPGKRLDGWTDNNPLLSGDAFQELARMGYLIHDDHGGIKLLAAAFKRLEARE